ncbi:unnamed protein product [Pleuronectes platessa]|uniref:Uncharacterized protein n=1 Tax=Pleuronectes platessa TaxID=8262 RepID=A0A9N7Z6D9_PLEPL|nr:unnamed protein product [Pleuronectes platessa]
MSFSEHNIPINSTGSIPPPPPQTPCLHHQASGSQGVLRCSLGCGSDQWPLAAGVGGALGSWNGDRGESDLASLVRANLVKQPQHALSKKIVCVKPTVNQVLSETAPADALLFSPPPVADNWPFGCGAVRRDL